MFPVDEWEQAGAPYLTEWCRIKLCMLVAERDLGHLANAMSTWQKLKARTANTKAQKRAHAANRREVRRQAALEVGVRPIPVAATLATHHPCPCGCELVG